jgi:cysteine desulfurase
MKKSEKKGPIYLDYMATTPVDPRVFQKMLPYLGALDNGMFGNPSSKHFYGLEVFETVEEARKQVASLINCEAKNIIWTSGATEANNLALKGAANFYKRQGKHIITVKTEHKSVLESCKFLEAEGFEITYLNSETDGLVDLNKLEAAFRKDTILVSIMHVNNETGVIQDITKIGEITRAKGILFHVDAVQSAGKIPIDLQNLKVDLLALSAHKVYGPKGIGALYIRPQPRLHLVPLIHGGSQQNGIRPGTLPTHQIAGMGEAFNIALKEQPQETARLLALRKRLWNGIKDLGKVYLNGSETERIAGNLNISFADINSELLIAALKDLAISNASSCLKNSEASYVLKAMNLPEDRANNAIRISLGRFTSEKDIEHVIEHINDVVTKLRKQ